MEVVGEEYGLGGNYRRVEPPALQLGAVAEGEDRDSAVGRPHPQRGVAAGVYAQQLGVAGRQGEFGAWGRWRRAGKSGAATCTRKTSISTMTAATAAAPSAMTARVRKSIQRRLRGRVAMFRLALMAER